MLLLGCGTACYSYSTTAYSAGVATATAELPLLFDLINKAADDGAFI